MCNLQAAIDRLRCFGNELGGLWAYDDDATNLVMVHYAQERMQQELAKLAQALPAPCGRNTSTDEKVPHELRPGT